MSPNAADRNFLVNCDVLLTAAAQDDSHVGISQDDATGSDQHMPSEVATAPGADSAPPVGAAAPGPGGAPAAGPPFTGLRTVLSTSSRRAQAALLTEAGGVAPPIVTPIPVFNCAPCTHPPPQQQQQQQPEHTAVAGQVPRGVPLLSGPHMVYSCGGVASHPVPLPLPDEAAASRQPPARLPEKGSSTTGDRDAGTHVAAAAPHASVVKMSQDALWKQLNIGRVAVNQARPLAHWPPAQQQPSLPDQANGHLVPAQRQPSLPNQASGHLAPPQQLASLSNQASGQLAPPQQQPSPPKQASGHLAPAQRQPSMPAAQQGSAEPITMEPARQGSLGALPTTDIRQGSIGSANQPHRTGSTTWTLPGRPSASQPGTALQCSQQKNPLRTQYPTLFIDIERALATAQAPNDFYHVLVSPEHRAAVAAWQECVARQ